MKTKEKLEEALDFCIEKAKSCSGEEATDYISEAVKIANSIIEMEKNESEMELEVRKYEESKFDYSNLYPIAAGFVSSLLIEIFRSGVLMKQTKMICNFEKTDTFTTSAGKGILGSLRFTPIMGRGDR